MYTIYVMHPSYLVLLLCMFPTLGLVDEPPGEIVRDAIHYWRGTSSHTEATMEIHRSDWNRTSSFRAWTSGLKKSLVRFTAPAKDAGSASLKLDNEMWSYSPKMSRVIKIPPSMMSQSWMGSDLSYNDLAKADELIDDYTHTLLGVEENEGKKVYLIESVPHEDAPVVWGKERLKVREDHIILEHEFFDQEGKLVKRLRALKITTLGGKLYPTVMRMENLEEGERWTQITHSKASFGESIPDEIFTLSNLRNPREQ